MSLAENTKFCRSTNVVSRKIGNEILVVPIRGGVGDLDAIFSFNGVGSDIWALLEKEQSLGELTAWIVDHYEATRAQAQSDVAEFLAELLQAGLATSQTDAFVQMETESTAHASR